MITLNDTWLEKRQMADPKPKPRKPGRPGRPRYPKGVTTEDTKQRLLEAAIRLFSLHGYDAISTGDVAREAQLTQSMVHYHFSSKEKLWKTAIHVIMRERGTTFPPPEAELEGLTPVDRLKRLIRSLILANARNPQFIRIVVYEGTIASPRLTWLVETYIGSGYKLFDDAIRDAIAEGAIPAFPVSEMTNTVTAVSLLFGLQAMIGEIYGDDLSEEASVESFSATLQHVLFRGLLDTDKGKPAALASSEG